MGISDLSNPYVHIIFTVLSTKQIFEKKSSRAVSESQRQFSEVKLNQKTLEIYTSWVAWKCRFTISADLLRESMLRYETSMNIDVLLIVLFTLSLLTHFLILVSFCTSWNTSENQTFPGIFRRHRKRPVTWNGLI